MEPQGRGSGNTESGQVVKPTGNPYINYVQAFRKNYKGPAVSCPQMVRMAADSWKSLSLQEKEPYVTLAKASPRRHRRTKRLQKRRRNAAAASTAAGRSSLSSPGGRGVKRSRAARDSDSE